MGYYLEGYSEAKTYIQNETDIDALLDTIRGLFGTENIEDLTDIEEVREEALRQIKEEFTDRTSEEYRVVEFWNNFHKIDRSQNANY